MKYRKLGKSELMVSEIGFGAWGIGGDAYGHTDDNESKKALLCAVEQGINFFDTSDIYGKGHSEMLIGETLSRLHDKIILATKGGTLPHSGKHMPQDFSVKHIKKSLEDSLKRLKRSYVDLYQLHSPGVEDLSDDLIKTLELLKKEGKIKALGVSLRSPSDGLRIIEKYEFDSIQANFNMIDHRAQENGLFSLVKEKNIGLIARTPFNFGFLTGAVAGINFEKGDHRANWPREQLKLWAEAANLFESICQDKKITRAQLALQFCLAFNMVSSVIPGMLRPNEVLENAAASEFGILDYNIMEDIKQIYKANTFIYSSLKQEILEERYHKK